MKRYLTIASLVLLAGCSGMGGGPTPPSTPAPADVASEATALATVPPSINPVQYLNLATALSNRWCAVYMNSLTMAANDADLASSEASLAGGVASGIAAASGAGILPMAIIGVVFPAISETLKAQGRAATGGVDPGAVLSLIQKEQDAYLGALVAPSDTTEADMDITNYALMCQPAGIRSAISQSTIGATATASGGATATASGGTASLRNGTSPNGIHHPPHVEVQ